MRNMSVSKLKCYIGCPQQFKLRYIERVQLDETPTPLTRGSVIHEFIEDFHEDIEIVDGKIDLSNIEYPEPDEEDIEHLNHMQKEEMIKNIKKQCRNYVEMEKGRWNKLKEKSDNPEYYFTPEHSEIKLYDNDKNYVGIIDRVQRNLDGTYTIYDFKTGSIKNGKSDYRKQLAMYHHLLNKNDTLDGKIKSWGIISPKDKDIWSEGIKKRSINALHKRMETVRKAIKNEQFECKEGFTCMYCEDLYQKHLQDGGNPTNEKHSW